MCELLSTLPASPRQPELAKAMVAQSRMRNVSNEGRSPNPANYLAERFAYYGAIERFSPQDESMLINNAETYLGLIPDISIASATEAITKVQQWPMLSEAGKTQLIDQIRCKTVQEPELPPQQPWIYKIKFRSFEHYMSQHSWTTFNGATISDEGKLYTMGAMIMSLGMTVGCLDEGAIAEAACIALFKSSRTDSQFFLQATRTLKRQLNMMANRLSGMMPEVPRPTDYPPDIEDFKSRYPTWYTRAFANSPHQACPLDLVMLAAIKARAVARMTKAGCLGVQPRRQGMSNHLSLIHI